MTVWEKVEEEQCYAVAIANYVGSSARGVPHLPLEVGELVQLQRRSPLWCWGRSLRTQQQGAFPAAFVVQRECTVNVCGSEVLASASAGVAHDIALTLREWRPHWFRLYRERSESFNFMELSMKLLLELRGQVCSGNLPHEHAKRLAATARTAIDKGDRMLGLELGVRDSSGQLVNPLEMSLYRLNALHTVTKERLDKNMGTTPRSSDSSGASRSSGGGGTATGSGAPRSFSVLVRVRNLIRRSGGHVQLQLALFDAQGGQLTEFAATDWPHKGPPFTALFTDLANNLRNEKLYLGCLVTRYGPMEQPTNDQNRRMSLSVGAVAGAMAGAVGTPLGAPPPPGADPVRLACGAAAGDISRYLISADYSGNDVSLPYHSYEKESLDVLLRKVMSSRELKENKAQLLWVDVQPMDGDVQQALEQARGASRARALSPGAAQPHEPRHDLYVTLVQAVYTRHKAPQRNIELSARLVNTEGETLPDAVSLGAGSRPCPEYRSCVYYHDDRPRWGETFKVCASTDAFAQTHLVVQARHRSTNEAKDRSEKPFALSYLRLMGPDGTIVGDGSHDLAVYKIEQKQSENNGAEKAGAAQCLGLPEHRSQVAKGCDRGLKRGVLSWRPRDSLVLLTRTCSTKLTQKKEILEVLKWSARLENNTLKLALQQLLSVPAEELATFMQDILDALFSILTQVPDEPEHSSSSYSVLVLDCILQLVALVGDHKFQHFPAMLLAYIQTSFCDTLAYQRLLSVLSWVMCWKGEAPPKRLLQAMKGLEWLLRLAARSKELGDSLRGVHGPPEQLDPHFQGFLSALAQLLAVEEDGALTAQGFALKQLPSCVPHALLFAPPALLSTRLVGALCRLGGSRLANQRLQCVRDLCGSPLSRLPPQRKPLFRHAAQAAANALRAHHESGGCVDKAARLLGADSALLSDARHARTTVELSVGVLGECAALLAAAGGRAGEEAEALAGLSLPALLHATAALVDAQRHDSDDAATRRMVCVLLDMTSLLSSEQFGRVARAADGGAAAAAEADAAEAAGGSCVRLVRTALALAIELVAADTRADYTALYRAIHRAAQHLLRMAGDALLQELNQVSPSAPEASALQACVALWARAVSGLIRARSLQLQSLTPARRARTRHMYGDMRVLAAQRMLQLWTELGQHQPQAAAAFGPAVLQASLVGERSVRAVLLPLLGRVAQKAAAEAALEGALVEQLDAAVDAGEGDAEWVACLSAVAQNAAPAVATLAQAAAALLGPKDALPPHQLARVAHVMDFYSTIDRQHMYLRYVYKLAAGQRAAGAFAEAALALKLHAELLSWSHAPVPRALQTPSSAGAAPARTRLTHRRLKEALYVEACELLAEGGEPDMAAHVLKQLLQLYEAEGDYAALRRLHQRLARLYEAALAAGPAPARFYRVLRVGRRGSPAQQSVFRAGPFEQLAQFSARLLEHSPGASLLPTLDPPTQQMIDDDNIYIQVNAVEPVPDGDDVELDLDVDRLGRAHDSCSRKGYDTFVYSRPFYKPDPALESGDEPVDEFATRWVERTVLHTERRLPAAQGFARVLRCSKHPDCPVAASARALRDSLAALAAAARPHRPLQPLSMKLTGTLDAAVMGGTARLERIFLTPSYEQTHPEAKQALQQLKALLARQLPVLRRALRLHAAQTPGELQGLHQHLVTRYRDLRDHVRMHYADQGVPLDSSDSEAEEVPLRGLHEGSSIRPSSVGDSSGGSEPRSWLFNFSNPLQSSRYSSSFGTLQPQRKSRDTRKYRKSETGSRLNRESGGVQWYTGPSSPSVGPPQAPVQAPGTPGALGSSRSSPTLASSHSSLSHNGDVVELTQELVPARPPRDDRRSSRSSLLMSPRLRDSLGTTDSNQEDEEPPPLPAKHRHSEDPSGDSNPHNASISSAPDATRQSYDDVVVAPRGSYLYSSLARSRQLSRGQQE